ncbi:MAG: hypothetical protein ACRDRO_22345 [Pseudonocardiaceae bacterium]
MGSSHVRGWLCGPRTRVGDPLLAAVNGRSLIALLRGGAERLLALQHGADGASHLRGEFPMWIAGPVTRVDHNYLSGYALLHTTLAAQVPGLPSSVVAALERVLDIARELPGRYQSEAGLGNWYSGRGSGLPCPVGYPWPGGRTLCLHDDYDDTAISAILTTLAPFKLSAPITAATFSAAAYDLARDALVPNSARRMQLAEAGAGVYQSWALVPSPAPAVGAELVWLPRENSVELTTVANVFTAVNRLGGDPEHPAQVASRHFVNALVTVAVERLLDGDASYLDFASSYYPRFPFAPLAFVVHDHVLTDGALLDPQVTAMIARAVAEVDAEASWRMQGFGTVAFWLNCCAWCLQGGLMRAGDIGPTLERVWGRLHSSGDHPLWPDFVFFHGAHIGDYSGTAYTLALMLETLALLHGMGFA